MTNPKKEDDKKESTSLADAEALPAQPQAKIFRNPVFILPPGWAMNPLLSFPRNQRCPCRSGLKFKKCCLNRLPRIIKEKDADTYREQMKRPDLVFVTRMNEDRVRQAAPDLLEVPEDIEKPHASEIH